MGSQPKKTKEIQSINQSINQLILFKDGPFQIQRVHLLFQGTIWKILESDFES